LNLESYLVSIELLFDTLQNFETFVFFVLVLTLGVDSHFAETDCLILPHFSSALFDDHDDVLDNPREVIQQGGVFVGESVDQGG